MNNDNFKWDSAELKYILKKFAGQIVGERTLSQFIDDFVASNTSSNERYWEILEFRTPYMGENNVSFTRCEDGSFYGGFTNFGTHFCRHFAESWLLENKVTIHSVRRKSDSLVFSVGDEVETNRGRGQHIIKEFKVIDNDMCVGMETFPTFYEFLSRIQTLPKRTSERPPLGIMPMDIWKEQRLDEINAAITRYAEANLNIPTEWIYERNDLLEFINPKSKL